VISTKQQELVDLAVAVVQENAALAISDPDDRWGREYMEAYAVTSVLRDRGLIDHPDLSSRDSHIRDRGRKSLEGRVKRALDAECSKPDTRLVRCSSLDTPTGGYPRLNGTRRGLHGQAVGYTTPECFALATRAVEAAQNQAAREAAKMDALLERAKRAGMPEPLKAWTDGVTFDRDAFETIINKLEV